MTFYAAGPPLPGRRQSKQEKSEQVSRLNVGKQSNLPGARPHVQGGGKRLTPEKADAPLPPIPPEEPKSTEAANLIHVPTILRPGVRRANHATAPHSLAVSDVMTPMPGSRPPGHHSPPKGGSPTQGALSLGHPQPVCKLNGQDRKHSLAPFNDGYKPPVMSNNGSYIIDSRRSSPHSLPINAPAFPSSPSTSHQHAPEMLRSSDRRSSGGSSDSSRPSSRHASHYTPTPPYIEPSVPVQNGSTMHHHPHPPAAVHHEIHSPIAYHRDYSPPSNSYRHDHGPPPAPTTNPSPRRPSDYNFEPPISDSTPVLSFPTPQIVVGAIPTDTAVPTTFPNYTAPLQPAPSAQIQPLQLPTAPLHAHDGRYSPAHPPTYLPPATPAYLPPPNASPQPPYQYNYPPPSQPTSPFYRPAEGPGPDPHLIARYSTPLPLPADEQRNSFEPRAQPPTPPSTNNTHLPDNAGPKPNAKRVKTQEELDAELARQLDAELNLDVMPLRRDSEGLHIPGEF
jgi:hypothetical protein